MNERLIKRVQQKLDNFEEIGLLLGTPEVMADQNRFRDLSRQYSELEILNNAYQTFVTAQETVDEAQAMLGDSDPDMRDMAKEELPGAKVELEEALAALTKLMMPKDPEDHRSAYLEIRAGTGGDEAALFSGDLLRMYSRYAENMGWKVEQISANEGEVGGYKEVICKVAGDNVYGHLKFESGAHRVQRVPATESQGRVHTSACTVAVLPEPDETQAIEISPADLRIDTFRASGAGGQHVNKTDSAIRITHLPTGVVVECQDERSQHKNKAKALSVLSARLEQAERDSQAQAISDARKNLVGSGDRSERIRTYNFPQGRVSDHRINVTLYRLDDVLQGDLKDLVEPLMSEYQTLLLAESGDQ